LGPSGRTTSASNSGAPAIAAMPLIGAPLAMNAIAGPEPSAISMLSAAIACCMRASPAKMLDSIWSPFCANSPLRIPISSGTNEKATPTALPTRSVSAARDGAAAAASASSAAPRSAAPRRSEADGLRPCGLIDHALSNGSGSLDRNGFAGATRGTTASLRLRVPDAVQHEAHRGVYARRSLSSGRPKAGPVGGLCGVVHRWSGTVPNARVWNGPGSATHHHKRVHPRLRPAFEVLRRARDKQTSASLACLALRPHPFPQGLAGRLVDHVAREHHPIVLARRQPGYQLFEHVGTDGLEVAVQRSEEHTSELQSLTNLVC